MLTRAGRGMLIGLLLAVASSGCSLGLMAPVIVEGQFLPVERAPQLRAGMREDEVEALLGRPLHRVTEGELAHWSYQFERRLRECRPYLGPIPLRPARTQRRVLQLTFAGGRLYPGALFRTLAGPSI